MKVGPCDHFPGGHMVVISLRSDDGDLEKSRELFEFNKHKYCVGLLFII